MLGEAVAIALTQPLLPLFYVLGRRMGRAGGAGGAKEPRPVVFVHGYFQNRVDFLYLARALRKAGFGPLYGFNYDWTRSIPACAARLGAFVERVCRETGETEVALVAHSLGGVICLEYLSTPEGAARVNRCVTIASPHAGVTWRGGMIGASARQLARTSDYMLASSTRALPIKVVSIFSSHDNMVHPSTTSALAARGGDDVQIEGVGHLGILFSREVAERTVRALAET
jgi:triacylglycerol lipase